MIAERVQQILEQSGAIGGSRKLVVAVSGGCDSVALLHILVGLRGALALDLHIASLDHGLRGEAGRADLDFVRRLATRWGLPHTLHQVDVPQLSRAWGTGIEQAARRARYDFLARVARQEGRRNVALGHHADDQAETILMHVLRGSGLRGLRGMRLLSPMPGHPQFNLLRPLLTLKRAQLEAHCQAHNLAYRQDETNWDASYSRNYLRHHVMPGLSRLNPDAVSALCRLAESAALDEDFVTSQVESLEQVALRRRDDGCSINRPLFLAAHPALRRRLLRRAFEQLAGAGESLTHERSLDLVEFCQTAQTGKVRDIGANLELWIGYEQLLMQRKGGCHPAGDYRLIPADTGITLSAMDSLEIAGLSIKIGAHPGDCDSGAWLALPAGCQLRLRTRRAGDRFQPKGMGGRSRKLKDWMIDRKIPRRLRDRIPLLCADGAIVAVCHGPAWSLAEVDSPLGSAGSGIFVCLD